METEASKMLGRERDEVLIVCVLIKRSGEKLPPEQQRRAKLRRLGRPEPGTEKPEARPVRGVCNILRISGRVGPLQRSALVGASAEESTSISELQSMHSRREEKKNPSVL